MFQDLSPGEAEEKLRDRPRNDKRILRAGVDELIKRERLKQEERRRIEITNYRSRMSGRVWMK